MGRMNEINIPATRSPTKDLQCLQRADSQVVFTRGSSLVTVCTLVQALKKHETSTDAEDIVHKVIRTTLHSTLSTEADELDFQKGE